MLFIIGVVVVFGSVVTGYLMHHGKLAILWQPNELVIIVGSAIGAMIIGNPGYVLKTVLKNLKNLLKGSPYNKKDYIQLLCFLFEIFKLMRTKGLLSMESHIETPHESDVFKKYPKILHDHHLMDFICDTIRLLTMGVDNFYQMDDMLEKELEAHHAEAHLAPSSVTNMADSMPALGIVAAVLGVITTMTSITEPPEILGGLIAAALVGTFLGVLLSYGVIAPIGNSLAKYNDAESTFYSCVKVAIIAHMQGTAPSVTVEYVRKIVPPQFRPSFKEVEDAINGSSTQA